MKQLLSLNNVLLLIIFVGLLLISQVLAKLLPLLAVFISAVVAFVMSGNIVTKLVIPHETFESERKGSPHAH